MISTLTHKTLQENLKYMPIPRLQIKETHDECVILSILPPLMFSVVCLFCQIGKYYLCLSWCKINMSCTIFVSEKQVLDIGLQSEKCKKK